MPDDFRNVHIGPEPSERSRQIDNVMFKALQGALDGPMDLSQAGKIISAISTALAARDMLNLTPGPQSLNEKRPDGQPIPG